MRLEKLCPFSDSHRNGLYQDYLHFLKQPWYSTDRQPTFEEWLRAQRRDASCQGNGLMQYKGF
jgi:hypothetical protein